MTTMTSHDHLMTTSMTTSKVRERRGHDDHDDQRQGVKSLHRCSRYDDGIGSHGSHGSHSPTAAAAFGMTTSMTTSGAGGHGEIAYSPTDAARMHALQALALAAQDAADARLRALGAVTSPHDREYLTAYAKACQGVAERLRNSPGYST